MLEVLANAMVISILQYISVSNQTNTLYTLNLHNVIRQLYLNEAVGKKEIPHSQKLSSIL